MKALSIKQPWALAIAVQMKSIETRAYPTKYRGKLLIVSSLKPDRVELATAIKNTNFGILKHLEYGKAIAVAELVDCRPMTKADEKAAMCEVYPKAHSWVLGNIRRVEPFPVKGQLGIYEVKVCGDCPSLICDGESDIAFKNLCLRKGVPASQFDSALKCEDWGK